MAHAEVVFCGKSLYLSGLASGLQSDGRVRVVRLESDLSRLSEELKMLRPDVVVFEIDAGNRDQVIRDCLAIHPLVHLIGLDPKGDSLTVYSGDDRRTASVDDLVPMIMEQVVT